MVSKLQQLEIELAKYQAEAQTWEKAFKLMAHHGVPVNEETLKKVRQKKTLAENTEEGQDLAKHLFLPIKDQFPEKGAFGVQNAFLSGLANMVKTWIMEKIVGALIQLIKDNAINAVDWLLDQTDEQLVNGYMKLDEEDRENLKRQLKEHPRFSELLKKIEVKENE